MLVQLQRRFKIIKNCEFFTSWFTVGNEYIRLLASAATGLWFSEKTNEVPCKFLMYGSFQGPQMVVTTVDPSSDPCKEQGGEIKL